MSGKYSVASIHLRVAVHIAWLLCFLASGILVGCAERSQSWQKLDTLRQLNVQMLDRHKEGLGVGVASAILDTTLKPKSLDEIKRQQTHHSATSEWAAVDWQWLVDATADFPLPQQDTHKVPDSHLKLALWRFDPPMEVWAETSNPLGFDVRHSSSYLDAAILLFRNARLVDVILIDTRKTLER
jgi:hypothetical protein